MAKLSAVALCLALLACQSSAPLEGRYVAQVEDTAIELDFNPPGT